MSFAVSGRRMVENRTPLELILTGGHQCRHGPT